MREIEIENNFLSCNGGGATQNISITIKQMNVFTDADGYNRVSIKLSLPQKIKASLGIGPTAKQLENHFEKTVFNAPKEPQ